MSALTVVVGLGTLLLAHIGSFHRFAVPFSVAVFLMVDAFTSITSYFGESSIFPVHTKNK